LPGRLVEFRFIIKRSFFNIKKLIQVGYDYELKKEINIELQTVRQYNISQKTATIFSDFLTQNGEVENRFSANDSISYAITIES